MIEVRRAVRSDLAAVAEIQAASPEASQWRPEEYLQYEFRVATSGNHLAGFVVWRVVAPGESELLNLAVAPGFRRQGVGRVLVESLRRESPGDIFLEVRESNSAARTFYESIGFQAVSVRRDYYHTPLEAAIVLKFHSC